jgi:hypothetical protein
VRVSKGTLKTGNADEALIAMAGLLLFDRDGLGLLPLLFDRRLCVRSLVGVLLILLLAFDLTIRPGRIFSFFLYVHLCRGFWYLASIGTASSVCSM